MTATPGWFLGADDVPLFAWWHEPQGGARGAAVLVGPAGDEQLVTHRALRALAERLEAAGLAVLRVDLPGTGDSGDVPPDDLVPAWTEAVVAAVAQVRAAGAEHVTVVGVRLGGLLAAGALPRLGHLDRIVLWDPWPSGQSYLRRLRALHMLSGFAAHDEPGSVEGPGTYIAPPTAAALKGLRLPAIDPAQPVTLVLRESPQSGADVDPSVVAPHAEVLRTTESEAWLDTVRLEAALPVATIEAVAASVLRDAPAARTSVEAHLCTSTTVAGSAVVEEVVRLGPRGLFGIASSPAADRAPRSSVVLADTATSYRVGPARLWVTLARLLAAEGHRVVRFDHRDLGDSPDGASPGGPRYYTEACVHDVREAVEASDLRDEGVPLVMVGHCSGSWASLMAARDLQPDALYLVNPLIWIANPPAMGPSITGAAARAAGTASLSWQARHWVRSRPPVRRTAQAVRDALVRVGVVGSSDALLTGLARGGTRVTCALGTAELEQYRRFQRFGGEGRLAAEPRVRLDVVEHDDHALKTRAVRDHLLDALPRWIDVDLPDAAR